MDKKISRDISYEKSEITSKWSLLGSSITTIIDDISNKISGMFITGDNTEHNKTSQITNEMYTNLNDSDYDYDDIDDDYYDERECRDSF